MYSFLVLGYIPGTNIQLSFGETLALMIILVGIFAIGTMELRHYLRKFDQLVVRRPLHASQLHLRAQ